MKRLIVLGWLLACGAASPALAPAQEQDADRQAAMEAWMEAAAPGDVHAMFARRAGKWRMKTRSWMQPDQPPMESEGTTEVEMVLGGRYLMEWVESRAWGMPFEGLSILGYDNTTQEVTSVWYDTFGTMTSISKGRYEGPVGSPIELTGEMMDVSSGAMLSYRTVTTFVDDDHVKFEYFMAPPGGEEFLNMVIEYERAE
jgi:hypothetical protein